MNFSGLSLSKVVGPRQGLQPYNLAESFYGFCVKTRIQSYVCVPKKVRISGDGTPQRA